MVFHVLNKGVGRMQLFRANKGYDAFRRVLEETLRVAPMRICAYCWLPNHFLCEASHKKWLSISTQAYNRIPYVSTLSRN